MKEIKPLPKINNFTLLTDMPLADKLMINKIKEEIENDN